MPNAPRSVALLEEEFLREGQYLANPFYAALTTVQASFAVEHGAARRFAREVIPFAAVAAPSAKALGDLVPLLTPGEEVYLTVDASQVLPPATGLAMVSTLPGLQMRLDAAPAVGEDDAVVETLTAADTEEILELKRRAFPGFFGPRAVELGRFFGVREPANGRLIAMGGERLATFREREVSAVCTDPAYAGQGHAARIVRAVVRHQARLGCESLLHVTAANVRARSLYERLGFHVTGSLGFVLVRRV